MVREARAWSEPEIAGGAVANELDAIGRQRRVGALARLRDQFR